MSEKADKRERAEEVLRKSENKLRMTLDATPFPTAVVDLEDDNIFYWSRSALTLFGHTAPTASEWYQIAYPDPVYRQEVIERWKPFLEKARESGIPVNTGKYRVTCRDGSERICEIYATFLPDSLIVTFNDITDRKRSEEALKKSKALLDATGLMARVGGWELDADTMEVTWTEGTYHIHEIPLDQKPPLKEAINFFHLEDRPKLELAIKRALDHGEPYDMEVRFNTAKGKHLWTRTKCQPEIVDGKVVKLKGVFQDITQRKQAEEKYIESVLKLKEAVKSGNVGLWDWDLVTNKVYFSAEWKSQIGYAEDEITDDFEEWRTRVHPDDLSSTLEKVQKSIDEAREDHIVEFRFQHKDGSYRWIMAHSSIIMDEKGKPIRMVGAHTDITDRKQAENSLMESEMQFRQVFENIGVGIAIYQPKAHGNDFIFVDINPAGTRIGQKPRAEHIGKSVLDVYPGVKDLGLFSVFQEVWHSGIQKHHPTTQYKDDKVAFWVDNYVYKLPSGEIMAVYEDVTLNKQAEETLKNLNLVLETRVAQRTAELGEASKELEDFVYSVSHDLRAPLRSISGFAQIIDRRHKASLNEEGQHYFENIIKASKQMGDLIDDLLKFSRLGRKSVKPEPVALDDVLKSAVETLSDQIETTSAQVVIPEQMPIIQGDLRLLTHIFINLIENAVKYHKPNEAPVVEVGFEARDPYVIISVSDNGIGIAPEYHGKIFNMFQRLHNQSEYPGTGIGLAAVKKAAQMMGGQVRVESGLGIGSVFKVEIPGALPT